VRPFRLAAPPADPGHLLRPRLVEALAERWNRRVVVVAAGAGFGKTTVLAQALHENRLAPRGIDRWVTCEPRDRDAGSLAADLAAVLDARSPAASDLVAAVAAHTPVPVAIVLDDVHEIDAGSPGAALLADLLADLPANGHLVLAARTEPPVALARLDAQGSVARLGEDDLAFIPGELQELADRHRVDASTLQHLGGWPALTALAVRGGAPVTGFVLEEILAHLDDDRRQAFAALVAVGGGSGAVASAAAGRPVDLASLVDGIPLVAGDPAHAVRPHALWSDVLGDALPAREVADARVRAADALRAAGELDDAAELLATAGAWSGLRELVLDACAGGHGLVQERSFARWRALLERGGRRGPELRLLDAIVTRARSPWSPAARDALEEARAGFEATGEVRGEVACLAHLGYLAWIGQDIDRLLRGFGRILELEPVDQRAGALASVGRAMLANATGDHDAALVLLAGADRELLGREWSAAAQSLIAHTMLEQGRAEDAAPHADLAVELGGPGFDAALTQPTMCRWWAGRVDAAVAAGREPGPGATAYGTGVHEAFWALIDTRVGRLDTARRRLARARASVGGDEPLPRAILGGLDALVAIAAGDDARGASILSDLLAALPLAPGPAAAAFHRYLAVTYVLVPASRRFWDEHDQGPCWDDGRSVAAALVAARASQDPGPLPAPGVVLAHLPLPWAAELAVRAGDLDAAGWLAERWPEATRTALRALAARQDLGPGATAALGVVPAAPRTRLELRLLGPTELVRDGQPVTDAGWRRERVRSLLAQLAVRGVVTRDELMTALWPELDADRAAHNLRVNLGHLHVVLEPDRQPGDAPWFVRQDAATLRLHRSPHLIVDLWDFEQDLAAADERDRVPTAALDHLRRAVGRWRGRPLTDLAGSEWTTTQADRLTARYVAAASRLGELLVADGSPEEAAAAAERAIDADFWSERAHRLAVAAALAVGDRGAARRALDRCHEALDELGVRPSPETALLERLVVDPAG
jgi:DNA-binding SARP family transcriptional activator